MVVDTTGGRFSERNSSLVVNLNQCVPSLEDLVTYMSSGLKRCIMAQNAKPSRKDVDMSFM